MFKSSLILWNEETSTFCSFVEQRVKEVFLKVDQGRPSEEKKVNSISSKVLSKQLFSILDRSRWCVLLYSLNK